jgi:bacillithiol system protein YtxJ
MNIQPITDEQALAEMVTRSAIRPAVLFKHSTRCPISAAARREFEAFAAARPDIACGELLVIEHRPLSLQVAADTRIPHQSPQAILFRDGRAVWSASHSAITEVVLQQACPR